MALGRGDDRAGLKLAEGVFTAEIAARLAQEHRIDAPIIATVAAILAGQLDIDAAIEALLARPLKRETV
ncbi:MAG: glycerol-3-phosphate dehydrogenase, partial [Aurantimonas coralicida]